MKSSFLNITQTFVFGSQNFCFRRKQKSPSQNKITLNIAMFFLMDRILQILRIFYVMSATSLISFLCEPLGVFFRYESINETK